MRVSISAAMSILSDTQMNLSSSRGEAEHAALKSPAPDVLCTQKLTQKGQLIRPLTSF